MTGTGRTLTAVYGLAALAAVSAGGYYLGTGRYPLASLAYTLAVLFLTAATREARHATAPASTSQPGLLLRLRARLRARRETRRTSCTCDSYWITAGAEHDDWCLMNHRSDTP